MRIALVTTYPPTQCGIANYSRELRRALASTDVTVLAERTASSSTDDAGVTRCWDRRGNWVDTIARAIALARPDVVHVQHEEQHYGQGPQFLDLLARVRALGARSVVTLHSVYDRRLDLPFRLPGASFHRKLAAVCDAIVAHQEVGMADVLAAHGVPRDKIHVIAHGTPRVELPDRTAARRMLDLPDGPLALFFGFIHARKNVHVAVEAFERACIDVPDARFVIAGRPRNNGWWDRRYETKLKRLMKRGIDAGRIVYRPGFIPVEHKPAYYAAADLLLLPHAQAYGSASGVLYEALAARRAIMCSRGKKFSSAVGELRDRAPFATPPAHDVAAWEIGMERLLASVVERQLVISLVERYAEVTSWQASAEHHARLYRAVCRGITNVTQVG